MVQSWFGGISVSSCLVRLVAVAAQVACAEPLSVYSDTAPNPLFFCIEFNDSNSISAL